MRLIRSALLMLVGVLVASPALAQEDIPQISRRHVESYARILNLSEEQREVALMLHDGYMRATHEQQEKFQRMQEDLMRQIQEVQVDGADPEAVMATMQQQAQEMGQMMGEMVRETFRLQDNLLADIRATLTSEQEEAWPRVVRKRQRDVLLGEMGQLSWAPVDLVDVLERLDVDEGTGDLREALLRYEADVDRPLNRLYTMFMGMLNDLPTLLGEMNEQKMLEFQEDVFEGMVDLRAINKRHARIVSAMLDEATRARFDEEVTRRAFPMVFGQNWVDGAFAKALALDDLTPEQRAAIEPLREQYLRERDAANVLWIAAIDKEDEHTTAEEKMWGSWDSDSPAASAQSARFELDGKYQERLKALLSEEQLMKFPELGQSVMELPVFAGDPPDIDD